MHSLLKAKTQTTSSHILEPLEMRRCLSSLAPAEPENVSALYVFGYTEFRWQDSGSQSNGHDSATSYIIETSPNGVNNWASLSPINAITAVTSGINRLWKDRHDRQKWYRMHAVDAEGDISGTTPKFQVDAHPEDYVVHASAAAQPSGPITLSWGTRLGRTYDVLRRNLGSTGTFAAPNSAAIGLTSGSYVDSTAVAGSGYEYSITDSYGARTYLVSGGNVAAVENRGKIVLLVDDAVAGALRGYVARLQSDLVGDGWTVLRHNVYRNQSVVSVKSLIQGDYNKPLQAGESGVRQVLLLGHVPVPYSGDAAPDGHDEVPTVANQHPDYRHYGAWATDAYYGDMDGVWTDTTVDTRSNNGRTTGYYAVENKPGDGRFDQNVLTTDDSNPYNIKTAPELAVGRVDMYDMPLAAETAGELPQTTEVRLLKRYLGKDHDYRQGSWDVRKRALIYDNFPSNYIQGAGLPAYSNLSALVGSSNIDAGNFFPANTNHFYSTANNSDLWGWADGAGLDPTQFWPAGYATSDGGGAADFLNATTSPDVVFNQLYGSFFPDWNHQNDFLRAAIAGPGYGLTSSSAVGATPQFWHMGMGETAGENLVFTERGQPNTGTGSYNESQYVDRATALMGDPTLRMAVVKPPTEVHAALNEQGGVFVGWTASADSDVVGYRVYRAASIDGPFVKISGETNVSGSYFVDEAGGGTDFDGNVTDIYMVRAVKREESNTGSYFNLSQGVFSEVQSGLVVGTGRMSRAFVDSVAFTFNRPVVVDPGSVILQRRVYQDEPVNENFALSTDDGGLSYVVTLLNSQNQPTPFGFGNGVYDIVLAPTGVSVRSTTLLLSESQHAYMFFRYEGDADGDGGVSINDFNILAGNFGTDHQLDADSDNDKGISVNDFNLLAANFGKSVWSLA